MLGRVVQGAQGVLCTPPIKFGECDKQMRRSQIVLVHAPGLHQSQAEHFLQETPVERIRAGKHWLEQRLIVKAVKRYIQRTLAGAYYASRQRHAGVAVEDIGGP